MSENQAFDLFANAYDNWFAENQPLLESEVRLLAYAWPGPGHALSVGCGTGLFETLLARDHGITIANGVEPAEAMAAIARARGLDVRLGDAETADLGQGAYDIVLFNGSSSYVSSLEPVFARARDALRPGGHVVVVDVPRESGYGVLYCLAGQLGSWDHPIFDGVKPAAAYPIPFVKAARWRTTGERIAALEAVGFTVVRTAQTLTRHPRFSPDHVEEPQDGHDRGDYVAVVARRD